MYVQYVHSGVLVVHVSEVLADWILHGDCEPTFECAIIIYPPSTSVC